jgi:hypothetical protein
VDIVSNFSMSLAGTAYEHFSTSPPRPQPQPQLQPSFHAAGNNVNVSAAITVGGDENMSRFSRFSCDSYDYITHIHPANPNNNSTINDNRKAIQALANKIIAENWPMQAALDAIETLIHKYHSAQSSAQASSLGNTTIDSSIGRFSVNKHGMNHQMVNNLSIGDSGEIVELALLLTPHYSKPTPTAPPQRPPVQATANLTAQALNNLLDAEMWSPPTILTPSTFTASSSPASSIASPTLTPTPAPARTNTQTRTQTQPAAAAAAAATTVVPRAQVSSLPTPIATAVTSITQPQTYFASYETTRTPVTAYAYVYIDTPNPRHPLPVARAEPRLQVLNNNFLADASPTPHPMAQVLPVAPARPPPQQQQPQPQPQPQQPQRATPPQTVVSPPVAPAALPMSTQPISARAQSNTNISSISSSSNTPPTTHTTTVSVSRGLTPLELETEQSQGLIQTQLSNGSIVFQLGVIEQFTRVQMHAEAAGYVSVCLYNSRRDVQADAPLQTKLLECLLLGHKVDVADNIIKNR